MTTYKFIQCDVFTDQVFAGNPLAVFYDEVANQSLDDVTMQKIAREMNLSETVFVLSPTDSAQALRRLRIFTPGNELPMAGHPVVGTWNMLARFGVVAPPPSGTGQVTIQQELKLGILPVEIDFADGQPVKVTMTQGTPNIGEALDEITLCAQALGLNEDEIGGWGLPIVVASTGVPYQLIPVRDKAALSRINVNYQALAEVIRKVNDHAVYVVTRETHSPNAFVNARMFGGESIGIGEDPATGSAAGPCAAALVHFGLAPTQFIIEQGVDMGRPSYINVEIEGGKGNVQKVKVGGTAVSVLRGELEL
ncbi:MAG: PhzF family phenazine biosynthesis protein [Acidobacteria bacterium]|nr:PhzF family phenazine biosynthesis protein [Acidobacteriota bacterium]